MKLRGGKQRRECLFIFISVMKLPCGSFFPNLEFRWAERAGAWVSRLSFGTTNVPTLERTQEYTLYAPLKKTKIDADIQYA